MGHSDSSESANVRTTSMTIFAELMEAISKNSSNDKEASSSALSEIERVTTKGTLNW